MRVAVTGATGFVGNALISDLAAEGNWRVTAITRRPWSHASANVRCVTVGDLVAARLPDGLTRRHGRGRARGGDCDGTADGDLTFALVGGER